MFIARATALQRDGAITAATAPAIAAICTRLDGLPLAIELAAARSTLLAPDALLARLEHRLALLTGGARDGPARQQTLRATIDWSYQLLDPAEQRLFARLGVFVGGWTLAAAEAICAGSRDGGVTVLEGLQALVDQQLVRHETAAGTARYRMLETIREYALERFATDADTEAIEGRYAAYYLALAEAAEAGLGGPEQVAWLDDLEREQDNLRAAFQWALARGEGALCLRLASAQRQFWYCSGHVREGIGALEAALALPSPVPAGVRAKGLLAAAWLLNWARNQARAQDYSTEALALAEASGDRPGRANALLSLFRAAEALPIFQQLGDRRGIAQALRMLELHASRTGDGAPTSQRHAQALALYRELGDTAEMAAVLGDMGSMARDQGDYARAERLFAEELELAQQVRDINRIAWNLLATGELALLQGDDTAARARLEESEDMFRRWGYELGVAYAEYNLGYVAQHAGDHKRMAAYFSASLRRFRQMEFGLGVALGIAGMGAVAAVEGRVECAARLFGAAAALQEALQDYLAAAHRIEIARNIAAVEERLDAATWRARWAEGQALTVEQAVAEAFDAVGDEAAQASSSWFSTLVSRRTANAMDDCEDM